MPSLLDSPRTRRLKRDFAALEQLAAESTIFDFEAFGTPPDFYVLRFRGRGLFKHEPSGEVHVRESHEVHIKLGAAYPRLMPELAWKSPIFHPNISLSGVVCLGGYGTYWVPSLALADLCTMLWDMARFANFDESSPYNREAAAWAKSQTAMQLPVDPRPLRDRLAVPSGPTQPALTRHIEPARQPEILFLGEVSQSDIVEAELVTPSSGRREAVLFIG
jgi:ubiquitin-protein ligase